MKSVISSYKYRICPIFIILYYWCRFIRFLIWHRVFYNFFGTEIYKRLGAIRKRLGAILKKLGAIHKELGAIHKRLGAIYKRLGAIYKRLGAKKFLSNSVPKFQQNF